MKFVKKNLICLVATALAIVSICLFFAECVKADKLDLAFTGFEVMFGQTLEKSFVSVEVIGFPAQINAFIIINAPLTNKIAVPA